MNPSKKIIFMDLIFENFINQPFCIVLFRILQILYLQISKNFGERGREIKT